MAVVGVEDLAPMLPARGALIGLDLGEKRIGVAVSDLTRMIATPRQTLDRGKSFAPVAAALNALAAAETAAGFVIGLPLNMNGTEGPAAQSARAFARNLSQTTQLPILLWDERWSTSAVTRSMLEADLSRAKRSERVDKAAAAYILQGALDRLASLKRTSP